MVEKPKTIEQIQFENRKRILIGIGVLFIILVIVAIIGWIIESPKTGKINILVAPTSSEVLVGGKKFSNGTHRIEPGTYNVSISKDGFEGYIGQITIEKGKTERLFVCLDVNNDDTTYYETHPDDGNICYSIQDYLAEKAEKEKYSDPIFKITPYHSYEKGFYIDPYLADDNSVVVRITLVTCNRERADGLKQNAIEWLQGKAILVENYQFDYRSCAYNNE